MEPNMPTSNKYAFMTIWIAKLLPAVLVFLCAFTTYVFVKPLSVDWLLGEENEPLLVVLIFVIYSFLLLLMVASFLRLVYVTYCEPPYVPLGSTHPLVDNNTSTTEYHCSKVPYIPPGLDNFYQKNTFITDQTGRPRWCFPCANWKPDRAHHCSQADRCIRKMDHFCPWVGGPVGENNYKFFIQFTSYGALYCAYVVTVLAVVVLKKRRNKAEHIDNVFYIAIGLISFFLFFSSYMALHSIWLTVNNLTQVENFRRRDKTYFLAIHVPPKEKLFQGIPSSNSKGDHAYITYPFEAGIAPMSWPTHPVRPATSNKSIEISSVRSNKTAKILPDYLLRTFQSETRKMDDLESSHIYNGSPSSGSECLANTIGDTTDHVSHSPKSGISESSAASKSFCGMNSGLSPLVSKDVWPNVAPPHTSSRTFAILKTNCGENPWDLGSYLMNWKTVMGESTLDWCFPIHKSPCCHFDGSESLYHFGSVVENLRSALG